MNEFSRLGTRDRLQPLRSKSATLSFRKVICFCTLFVIVTGMTSKKRKADVAGIDFAANQIPDVNTPSKLCVIERVLYFILLLFLHMFFVLFVQKRSRSKLEQMPRAALANRLQSRCKCKHSLMTQRKSLIPSTAIWWWKLACLKPLSLRIRKSAGAQSA